MACCQRFVAICTRLTGIPRENGTMETSGGFNLGSVLLVLSGLFCLTTLYFGTRGGYYDTDDYDGNGTAH
jgi:hypothetical protein